jgi:hypothetical protein
MSSNKPSNPYDEPTRARRRRGLSEERRGHEQVLIEKDAFLRSQLEPGESILASSSAHDLITDRRILVARHARAGGWIVESIRYPQISRWVPGSQHDGRPLIWLTHEPVLRPEHRPEHRFLWFEWGNAEAQVPQTTTHLSFHRRSDPAYVALREQLQSASIPQGEPFVERPEGTREERKGTGAILTYSRHTPMRRIRSGWWGVSDVLYRGQLKWWLRLLSWAVLTIPAWFINPWLVLPAVVLAEAAWIFFLQLGWRLEQRRRRA